MAFDRWRNAKLKADLADHSAAEGVIAYLTAMSVAPLALEQPLRNYPYGAPHRRSYIIGSLSARRMTRFPLSAKYRFLLSGIAWRKGLDAEATMVIKRLLRFRSELNSIEYAAPSNKDP